MSKTPRFLFCENQMDGTGEEFILHAREPRFLVRVHNLEELDEAVSLSSDDIGNLQFQYINVDGLAEDIILQAIAMYDANPGKDAVHEVLKRMADWYYSYLKWQDAQMGSDYKDYNERVPGLKILYSEDDGWAILYKGISKGFDSEPEMDDFLQRQFGITDEDLEEGVINQL